MQPTDRRSLRGPLLVLAYGVAFSLMVSRSLRGPLLVLAYGVAFSLMASLFLVWLLGKVVPVYAGMFEAMGMALPLNTRAVIAASMWTGRLLPMAILAGLLVAPLVLLLAGLAARRYGTARMLEIAAGLSLATALLLSIAVGGTIVGLQQPFQPMLRAMLDRQEPTPAATPRP